MLSQRFVIGMAAGAVALLAILAVCSAPASAGEYYVKAEIGTTVDAQAGGVELSDEATYGIHGGTSVGPVRVEAGVRHVSGNVALGPFVLESSAINYTGTAYLDHSSGFYVGAGVDYYDTETSIGPFVSMDDSGYGYHVSGGYATRINDRTILEVQARYSDAELDSSGDLTGTAITIGLRTRFGSGS